MAEYRMPALGADMETGKLVQWRVAPGSRVRPGDVVAVVETHKGAIDCEIFLDGIIDELVPEGTVLPVGGVLARVRVEGETTAHDMSAPALSPALSPAPAPAPAAPPPLAPIARAPASTARLRITPAARRQAQRLHLDLDPTRLQGSGVGGSICLADVLHAPAPPAPAPAQSHAGFDPAAMRQAIGAAMSRSKREIPHYYLAQEIDFDAAQRWLDTWNAGHPPPERLLPAALLLKASARALAQVPQCNGFWNDGRFTPGDGVHVGWAISMRGGGLVAPAIHHADRQSVPDLMTTMRDLVQRVRSGGLRSSEMTDPTVTVTSLGERGADAVLGVIYPPQVALLGFGRVVQRPRVLDGAVVPRWTVQSSLAADHRASDGHLGGQLLAAIDAALQRPEEL